MRGVELFNRNVSAKLQKSLAVLHAQSAVGEEAENQEAIRIAGPPHFMHPSAAGHHKQKMLAG